MAVEQGARQPIRLAPLAAKERLEILLESTDTMWRMQDLPSLASAVVSAAGRILPGVDCVLAMVSPARPDHLEVVAATEAALGVGRQVPIEGSVSGRALHRCAPIEALATETVQRDELLGAGVGRVRVVPLLSSSMGDGRPVMGVLQFLRHGGETFDDQERRITNDFAQRASLAIHRLELLARAQRDARRLEIAFQTAIAMTTSLSPRSVTDLLLEHVVDAMGADRATLSSIDHDTVTIEATFARAGEKADWIGQSFRFDQLFDQPVTRQALQSGRPALGGPYEVDAIADQMRLELASTRYTAAVPLLLDNDVSGLLLVARLHEPPFTSEDLLTLQLIGNAAMLSLRNAWLFDEVQASNNAKSEFLNLAAHELRTPLSVLSGYTSMLLDGSLGRMPERWRAPLEVMAHKAEELNGLVESLLVAARVQRGVTKASPEPIDLCGLVDDAVARARASAGLRGGEVDMASVEGPVTVNVDRVQIGRTLDNLLSNAITYSVEAPRVTVRLGTSGGRARVEVEDQGRGIPPEAFEKIFDQFVRIDDPMHGFPAGTGLGLYICRALARTNGGEVSLVRSVPGEGSTFALEIPLA